MNRPIHYGLASVLTLFLATIGTLQAQPKSPAQLDSWVSRALDTFHVPGMAVAIVKDGQLVTTKGYGQRSIKSTAPVDEHTLFGIASNSKAFTAAAIGILVDEGKLRWDDKLIDYLPEFKMYAPYVTHEFTLRDMLTHRSGLGIGAGDLMRTPDSSNFTLKDIIYSLRFIKPETSFRSRYAYDNIFYLVAGELIARVSGMSWGDFIEKRLLKPLQMTNSGASYKRVKQSTNIIDGHRELNGQLVTISRTDVEVDAGAGGIYTSAADMSRWMLMQLNNGRYGPNLDQQIFSEPVHKEMWTPQVIIPASRQGIYNTHFGAYGLGWFLVDLKGVEQVFHTGQDDGMISEVALIPELGLGITVLSNQEGGGAVRAIIDQLTDYYLGISGTDRIQEWADKVEASRQSASQVSTDLWKEVSRQSSIRGTKQEQDRYVGHYQDNWFGQVEIQWRANQLWFSSRRSPQLRGPMRAYKGNTFIVRWENPQIQADALVLFTLDGRGRAMGMTMKRASAATSSAYDFQDLSFQRLDGPRR